MTTSLRRLIARPSTSQIANLDCHVATMTILLQVSVPNTFFASSPNYSFKMQAGHYSCKNLTLEMDLTNTSSAAVQLEPTTAGGLGWDHHWVRSHPLDSPQQGALGLSVHEQQQHEDDWLSEHYITLLPPPSSLQVLWRPGQ